MNFAERNGFVDPLDIVTGNLSVKPRNRLYNKLCEYLKASTYEKAIVENTIDALGYVKGNSLEENYDIMKQLFLNCDENDWYMPFMIIEQGLIEAEKQIDEHGVNVRIGGNRIINEGKFYNIFQSEVNIILDEEKSGYRIMDDIFVPITSEHEIDAIKESTQTPFKPVNTHIKKALSLYADRKNPDFENSIKESISAVESMCCIITGLTGKNATLGNALKKLKENGVEIHGAMIKAFNELYGYTSDADGIRHGGIDFTNAPAEDAKYMLVSCSAFVNYLIEKYRHTRRQN